MEVLVLIKILRANTNQLVDAKVIQLTQDLARDMIDNVWWKHSDLHQISKDEGDSHWVWEYIVDDYSSDNFHECLAIISGEKYLEGAMAYRIDAKSSLEIGKGSLYIGWLATAPRNRNWLVNQSIYKGIGTVLLYLAVRESYQLGLEGRICLESLPTPSTVKFYENKGFVRTDLTQDTVGLLDYELPKSAALAWLKKEGDLP